MSPLTPIMRSQRIRKSKFQKFVTREVVMWVSTFELRAKRTMLSLLNGGRFQGNDHLPFVGNQKEMLDAIAEFLTGLKPHEKAHRILATVLHAQVLPTSRQSQPNETKRIGLSQAHFTREIELFRGHTIQAAPNCVSASFDGPARAIRAALAIRDSASRLGVEVQLGLHTGECEFYQQKISGTAVEIAERVASFGTRNEVIVSSTVKDLVAGSGIQFVEKLVVRLADDLPECCLFQVKS